MWHLVSEKLPDEKGTYLCKIKNGERTYEAKRMFQKGHWFGGCRPFTDNEQVLEWKK